MTSQSHRRTSFLPEPRPGRPPGKFTTHRKLDRLRGVLEAYPTGLTLSELAQVLRVTPRSVRRYLQELDRVTQLESVPTTPGGPHKWRVKPTERGRALYLRRTQAYGLLATRRMFEALRGSAIFDEMELVSTELLRLATRPGRTSGAGEVAPDARLEDRVVFVPDPGALSGTAGEELDIVFTAAAELRVARFTICENGAPSNERIAFHPYAIVMFRGSVFAIGLSPAHERVRVFPIESMRDTVLDEDAHFCLPETFCVDDYLHGEFGVAEPAYPDAPAHVLVEFEAEVADRVRGHRFHPTQRMAIATDGRVRVSLRLPRAELVRPWLLSWGADARVIEPRSLAREVAEHHRRAARRYAVETI